MLLFCLWLLTIMMCFRAEAIKLIDAKWGDSEVAMALAF
jgi:hypothetical protein